MAHLNRILSWGIDKGFLMEWWMTGSQKKNVKWLKDKEALSDPKQINLDFFSWDGKGISRSDSQHGTQLLDINIRADP